MTLQELYQEMGGDYAQALRVLHVEKLLDKHIRKFPKNAVLNTLFEAGELVCVGNLSMAEAGETLDATQLFEAGHAVKGISANLGLTAIADAASEITEEFRPGSTRRLTDDEVKAKVRKLKSQLDKTADAIARYEQA